MLERSVVRAPYVTHQASGNLILLTPFLLAFTYIHDASHNYVDVF